MAMEAAFLFRKGERSKYIKYKSEREREWEEGSRETKRFKLVFFLVLAVRMLSSIPGRSQQSGGGVGGAGRRRRGETEYRLPVWLTN